ncbi:adhesion G-protein coupled receptor D1-like isoform X1 [Pecten maximus]|uniref:adhesion G-protein coupled receptor D1-like isoform X1 n=2 Tax=Pecten maximus TaxID=6579 RepID=UPI001458E408|nr:adhesion G-protein coupled receptor D1-like isoform X1 [Pecten maximus]
MANYMFLMEWENNTLTEWDEHNMIKMTVTGCGFSFVGLMLTLCLLCFLPLANDGLYIITNMCISMVAAQLAFIGSENTYPEKLLCKTATSILHYLFLCVHFSSLCFGVHLMTKLKAEHMMNKSLKRTWILLTCWGAPGVIVAITSVIRGDTYGTNKLCWLATAYGTKWAFLGPVMVIQLINGAIFVIMMLTRMGADSKKGCSPVEVIKQQVMTAISLIPCLGLMWSLGFAVTFGTSKTVQYLFVVLAALQGLLIFLGHIMTHKQVRKSLCVKMNPSEYDMSEKNSDDYTRSSNIVEAKRGSNDSSTSLTERRHSEHCLGTNRNQLVVPPAAKCRHRSPRKST